MLSRSPRETGRRCVRAITLIAGFAAVATALVLPASAGADPPANDNFADAAVLTPPQAGSTTATDLDATSEPGEPQIGFTNSLWFSWTAPSNSKVIFDTVGTTCVDPSVAPSACASGFDTALAVYTGTSVDSLTPVAANDDCPGRNNNAQLRTSCLAFVPSAGTTYHVQVDNLMPHGGIDVWGNIVVNWRTAPPAPSIALPGGPVNTSTPTFTFTDSGATDFTCSIDNNTSGAYYEANCASPYTTPPLSDGDHTLTVKTKDTATGITGDPQLINFTVATAPPVPPPPTIDSNTGSAGSRNATITFSDGNGGVTFLCSLDGNPFTTCTSPVSYSGLGDSMQHTFSVKAQDAAGLTSDPNSTTWTIGDLTPPPAPSILSTPQALTTSKTGAFTYSDSESGVSFLCTLDGVTVPCPLSGQTYSNLADGPHNFSVQAKDAAGNTSSATSFSWTVSTLPPPAPTILTAPAPQSTSNGAGFTFSDTQAGVTFWCSLDGAPLSQCSSGMSYSNLAPGFHNFAVYARDALGTQSAGAAVVWQIVTTPLGMKRTALATLQAMVPSGNKENDNKLRDAISKLQDSMNPSLWIGESHLKFKDGDKVFDREAEVTDKLRDLISDKKSTLNKATLQSVIDNLVADDRQLAQTAIDETPLTGKCQSGLRDATREMTSGDIDSAAGRAHQAIDHYRNAWKKVQEPTGDRDQRDQERERDHSRDRERERSGDRH